MNEALTHINSSKEIWQFSVHFGIIHVFVKTYEQNENPVTEIHIDIREIYDLGLACSAYLLNRFDDENRKMLLLWLYILALTDKLARVHCKFFPHKKCGGSPCRKTYPVKCM